jgi:hypothetical protein
MATQTLQTQESYGQFGLGPDDEQEELKNTARSPFSFEY